MKVFSSTLAFLTLSAGHLLAQDGAPLSPPTPDQGLTQTLIMVGIALAFFYLILWRPEQKRRKELEDLRGSLSKGDEVVAMGIVGHVSKVEEEHVILKMVDGNRIKFLKGAISEVFASSASETSDK